MKVLIYDIETLQEFFLINIYVPEEDKSYEFMVSQWQNNLDGFVRFVENHPNHYWVGYNNLRFDSQVVTWVLKNCHNWHELSGLEICAKIAQYGGNTPLVHYTFHDANGKSIAVEYIKGELQITDNPTGVMTNDPPFQDHLNSIGNYSNLSKVEKPPLVINGAK